MNWVIPMAIFRFVLQKDVYLVKLMWLCFSGSNWLLTLLLTYKTWDSGDQIMLKRMGGQKELMVIIYYVNGISYCCIIKIFDSQRRIEKEYFDF